jgi:hypothetical protein
MAFAPGRGRRWASEARSRPSRPPRGSTRARGRAPEIEDGGGRREGERRFSVVHITPRGGRPFELWIDVATGLVDRYAEKDATRLRTTFLSDYREVGGVRLPFAIRTTTGDPRYDDRKAVERVVLDEPLDDARFAPPPPPPPDFAIAGGEASTTVPFELLNNHIYVEVRLNGKGPFKVLCDSLRLHPAARHIRPERRRSRRRAVRPVRALAQRRARRLRGMDVVPGGPGAKAGLRVGGRVLAVGGKPAAGLSLPKLRERLRTEPAGTRLTLSLESRGERSEVALVLADLV